MSCGCGYPPTLATPRTLLRERAAMCHLCLYAEHHPANAARGAVACTVSGKPVGEAVRGECPRGRFPDADGRTRAVGFRWLGVPMVHRLYLWLTHERHPSPRSWRGCGCVSVLRRAWSAVVS